ncbi:DUF4097 family beta strand repeat-containing protein [Dokdonia sp. Hel_I_53]|uniref:DUF4097 family beta strand repeat-containing protein n=1 Tax=Dokdonia sp. Hel_I_53 TaxID=1566287 RepID=UPI00119958EC|nr:DUF4097 family beta strand repeat-containing protein [Dokdonia sp. Hel_I_53]TVZ52593.1 hypothetical protein OD90_1771 [Dokdonia sp. Hel_I_53]
MKLYTALFIVFFSVTLTAQKRVSKTYSAAGVKELQIHSNEIFEIKVNTAQTDIITIYTVIDGEIFASTLLNTQIDNEVLQIKTGTTPDYVPFNDKLSAHKVMAIELEIIMPLEMDLSIFSTLSSVITAGKLGKVRIDLGRGNFTAKKFRFRESAKINTISGNVDIELDQAHVTAQSRNGIVVIPTDINMGAPLSVESLDGDITIRKSQ